MFWFISETSLDLPDDTLQQYKDLFSYFDRDGGGTIGKDELAQVMRAFKWNPTDQEIKVTKKLISHKDSYIGGIKSNSTTLKW